MGDWLERLMDRAIRTLLEESKDMSENGNGFHANEIAGNQNDLEGNFGHGAGRAIFRPRPSPKVGDADFNVSGEWRWAEREAYLRSLESNDIQKSE